MGASRPLRRHRLPAIRRPGFQPRAGGAEDDWADDTEAIDATVAPATWGALPLLSVTAGAGLLSIASADVVARSGSAWGDALFWAGILAIVAPIAVRLALPHPGRTERLGAAVLLGLALYLVKVLASPDRFAFGDEFAHWRTAQDIAATGRLLSPNPLSIVSPDFPGLEIVTTALASVTGLELHAAGLLIIGTARLVLGLAVFLLVERLSGSARIAGLASLVYAANPNFVFWSAQFAYESLALPMALAVLWLAARRTRTPGSTALDPAMTLVALALVPTHHLTTYLLGALFVVWAVVAFVLAPLGAAPLRPPMALVVALPVLAIAWVGTVARATIGYLEPVVGGALHDAIGLVLGERTVKTFFRGDPTLVSPVWERLLAFGAVVLLAVVLLVGLWRWLRVAGWWPRFRRDPLAWALAVAAAAWFPAQAVRAVQAGTEMSNRAGEFLLLPVGFVVAVLLARWWLGRQPSEPRIVGAAAFGVIVVMGGVIVGLPRWARLPGPYLVSGDTRGITTESIAVADLVRSRLGDGQRLIADQANELVLATYGRQDPQHGVSWVYFRGRIGTEELEAIDRDAVAYVVVDARMTSMLPLVGYYYEPGEPGRGVQTEPMQPADLAAFDLSPTFRRVIDSGDIAIYQRIPGAGAGA